MDANPLVDALKGMKECFDRTTACLDESDAGFVPAKGMLTVAQQVAHVAQTVDWFLEGAFRPEGFDLDFAGLEKKVRATASLADARAWFARSVGAAIETLGSRSPAELAEPIADGPILAGAPRSAIVAGLTDHTAHHRGSLAVYARLRGKTPAMPYA